MELWLVWAYADLQLLEHLILTQQEHVLGKEQEHVLVTAEGKAWAGNGAGTGQCGWQA